MKAFLISVASVLFIFVAILVAPFFIPTKGFEKEFIQSLNQYIDGQINYDSFQIRIFPYPKFIIKELDIVQRFPDNTLEKVFYSKLLSGSFSPLALFKGDIITDITARQTEITLNNKVAFFTQKDKKEARNFKIKSFAIRNGKINYLSSDNKIFSFKDLELLIMSSSVSLAAKMQTPVEKPVYLTGNLALDKKTSVFEINDGSLILGDTRFNLEMLVYYALNPRKFDFQLSSLDLLFSDLFLLADLDAKKINNLINGRIAFDFLFNGTRQNSNLQIQADASMCHVNWKGVIEKPVEYPLKLNFNGKYESSLISLDKLLLTFGTQVFKLNGSIVNQPGFPVQMQLEPSNLTLDQIAVLFPFLKNVNFTNEPSIDLEVKGKLFSKDELEATGHMSFDEAVFWNKKIGNLEVFFNYKDDEWFIGPIEGELFEGKITGQAKITGQDDLTFFSELVVNDINVSKLFSPIVVLGGDGQLNLTIKSKGPNLFSDEQLSLDSFLNLKQGNLISFSIDNKFFTADLINRIEEVLESKIDGNRLEKLDIKNNIRNFKANAVFENKAFVFNEVAWETDDYNISFEGDKEINNLINGKGRVILKDRTVKSLFIESVDIKKLYDTDDQIVVPIKVYGTLGSIKISPDTELFPKHVKTDEVQVNTKIDEVQIKLDKKIEQQADNNKKKEFRPKKKTPQKEEITTDIDDNLFKVIIGD